MSLLGFWPVLAAYLLGGVLGGRIVGRLRGVDLRTSGSGNIGATNALRTQGKGFALAVLLIDGGKGALAALALPKLANAALLPAVLGTPAAVALPFMCGAAATLGHCFPPWHRFDGGKGVATLAGAFLALLPAAFFWALAAFVLTVLVTGTVSLATLLSVVAGLAVAFVQTGSMQHPACIFTATMLMLVLYTHRENWRRLAAGTESRFENARLLGKLLRLP